MNDVIKRFVGRCEVWRRSAPLRNPLNTSLDGFVARKDGRVDWLETSDEFVGGDTMDPGFVEAFLKTIDCYVMGSRTYETALRFEAQGLGWSYGDKPTFVLTSRELPRTRDTSSSTQAISRSS